MNVYEKLNAARLDFQSLNIKMSGKNNYSGYSYYELSDIIPIINELAKELKFTCVVSFADIATLNFIDVEKPSDFITFHSPMSTANLKGCHEVQNLGAVETYIRRYLYQTAFEIIECDELNKNHNPKEDIKKQESKILVAEIIEKIKANPDKKIATLEWMKGKYSDAEIKLVQET